MIRKILLVGAAFCLLLTSLFAITACRKKDNGDDPIEPGVLIAGTGESSFSIVYPTRWEDNEMNAAMDLKYAFSDAYESDRKSVV